MDSDRFSAGVNSMATGVSNPLTRDWTYKKRPRVSAVEPTLYHQQQRTPRPFPLLQQRDIEIRESVTPILSEPESSTSEYSNYPGLTFGIPSPYHTKARGSDPGVSQYEVLSATVRKFEEMGQRVLRLHKSLQILLPSPLKLQSAEVLRQGQARPGSVQLSLAMAQAMWEAVERLEIEKDEELVRRGKTEQAYSDAILRSYELAEFRKELETAAEFYCRRSYMPEGFQARDLPFAIPVSGDKPDSSGYNTGNHTPRYSRPVPVSEDVDERPQLVSAGGYSEPVSSTSDEGQPLSFSPDSSLLQALREKETTCDQLQQEVDNLQFQLQKVTSQSESNAAEVSHLASELSNRQVALEQNQHELASLQSQLQNTLDSNQHLAQENATLQSHLGQQGTLIDQLQETEGRLKGQLAEIEALKNTLDTKAQRLEQQIAEQNKRLQQQGSELQQVQHESSEVADQAEKRINEIGLLLEQSRAYGKEIQAKVSGLELSEASLKEQLEQLQVQLKDARQLTEDKLLQASNDYEQQQKQDRERLKKAESDLNNVKLSMEKSLNEAVEKLQQAEQALHSKDQEIARLELDRSARNDQEKALRSQLASSREEVEQLEALVEEKAKEIAAADKKREEVEVEVLNLQKQVSTYQQNITSLEKALQEAQNEAELQAREKYERTEQDLRRQINELKQKESQLLEDLENREKARQEAVDEAEAAKQELVLKQSEHQDLLKRKELEFATREQALQRAIDSKTAGLKEAASWNETSETARKKAEAELADLSLEKQQWLEAKTKLEARVLELEDIVATDNQRFAQEHETFIKQQKEQVRKEQLAEALAQKQQTKLDELQRRLKEAENLIALNAEAHKNEVQALTKRAEASETQVSLLQNELKTERDAHEKARVREQVLKSNVEALQLKQTGLTEERDELKAKRDQLQHQLTEKALRVSTLEKEIQSQEQKISALSDGDQGVKGLTEKTSQLEEEVRKLKQNRDKEANAAKDALREKQVVDLELERLRTHEEELLKQHDYALREVQGELQQRDKNIGSLQNQLDAVTLEKNKAEKQVVTLQAEMDEASFQLQQQQLASQQLEKTSDGFREERDLKVAEVQSLKKRLEDLEGERREQDRKIAGLDQKAKELTELQGQYATAKDDLRKTRKKLHENDNAFEEERRGWDRERESLRRDIETFTSESRIAGQKWQQLNKQWQELDHEYKLLKRSHKQANDELETLGPERDRLAHQAQTLQAELTTLKATHSEQYRELQAQHVEVSRQLVEANSNLQQKERKIDELEEQLKKLRQTIQQLQFRLDTELQEALTRATEAESLARTTDEKLTQERVDLSKLREEKAVVDQQLNNAQEFQKSLSEQMHDHMEQLGEKAAELEQKTKELFETQRQVTKWEDKYRTLELKERKATELLEEKEHELSELTDQLGIHQKLVSTLRQEKDETTLENQALLLYGGRTGPLVREQYDDIETASTLSGDSNESDGIDIVVDTPEFSELVRGLKNFNQGDSRHLVPTGNQELLASDLFRAGAELEQKKEEIEQAYKIFSYKPGEPPSQSRKREDIIQALSECRATVEKASKKYGVEDSRQADAYQAVKKHLAEIDASMELYRAEQKFFNGACEQIREHRFEQEAHPEQSLMRVEARSPNDLVSQMLVKLQHLQKHSTSSPIEDELNGYTAGLLVTSVCTTLMLQLDRHMTGLQKENSDEALKQLLSYRSAMQRMLPGNLPLEMVEAIPPGARVYMKKHIARTISQLERIVEQNRDDEQTVFAVEETSDDPRGRPGKKIALELLENPDFVLDLVAFIGNASKSSQGIERPWYQYPEASLAWLRDMRQKYGLVDMPTFSELYEVCEADLHSRNASRLLTAKVEISEGGYDSNSRKTKRQKLSHWVEACKQQEQELQDTPEALRGQAQAQGQLVRHPHREVLDCFKPGTGSQLLDDNSVARTRGSYRVTRLGRNGQALFNTFFDGTTGGCVKQSKVTGTRYLQLENEHCIPPLVFEERRSGWQVSMANAVWTVDPSVLLDHPDMVVPFEDRSGVTPVQRDWIPVRDESGNTGILVLQKVPGKPQYFLYEVDSSGQLTPRPISDNPVKELHQARFLTEVVKLNQKVEVQGTPEPQPDVEALFGSRRKWLPQQCMPQALELYANCRSEKPLKAPIPTVDASGKLKFQTLEINPLRNVIKIKRDELHKSSTSLKEYTPANYAPFCVDSTFNLAGNAFVTACQKQLRDEDDPVLREVAAEQELFRQEAFKALYVFEGCELKPELIQASMDRAPLEGTPAYVLLKLDHVMKVNRSHCTRLKQQMAVLQKKIISEVTRADRESCKGFSNRQILEQVLADFERGRLPEHCQSHEFVNMVANLILAENDLTQTGKILSVQASLRRDLKQLAVDAPLMISEEDRVLYGERCRKFNLKMALCATAQDSAHKTLEGYAGQALTTEVMAVLAFERRAGTVMRTNQVEEVQEALEDFTESVVEGRDMSRVSHKGTGWGKSTILKILTDHCTALIGDRTDCSVIIVAPETNQAELDIDQSRYYAGKGRAYHRLNLEKDFIKPGAVWWTEKNMTRIENICLGLDPSVPVEHRQQTLQEQGRAPVGISIKDVQILMHLMNGLEQKQHLEDWEQRVVDRLHLLFTMLGESPAFFDEWASAVVPYRQSDPQGIAVDVNRALQAIPGYQIGMDDVIRSHDQFVMSCRRRQLLCATGGTNYGQAVVAGTDDPEEIKQLSHTDPFTTQQRFHFWMTKAQPIFVTSPATENRPELLRQVINKVGPNRSLMVFDGTESGEHTVEKAKAFYEDLKTARQEVAPGEHQKPRGMVFYNQKKEMQKYLEDDLRYGKEKGGTVLPEEEAMMRRERGAGIDVYLTQEQSEGTDAPQGKASVGVYMGLVEQGRQGRSDAVAQQVGRLMRASTEPRDIQQLFVVVDVQAVKQFCETSEEEKRLRKVCSELEVAQTKLLENTGQHQEKLKARQRELVNQPLDIPDSLEEESAIRKANKKKGPEEIQKLLEAKLDERIKNELQHLKMVEWSKAGIVGEFAENLARVKELEWQAKKAWVILAAVEMARREHNEDTEHYEQLLDEAQVRSHVSGQLEKEYQWLQDGCGGVCENLNFTEKLSGNIGSERQQQAVVQSFRETTLALMKQSQRRIPEKVVAKDKVERYVQPDYARKQIEQVASDISRRGLDQVVTDPLKLVRASLYEKAVQSRKAFIERAKELESIVWDADRSVPDGKKATGSYVRNVKELIRVREKAERELQEYQSVIDGNDKPRGTLDNLDDMAIDLRADMEQRYIDLMDAVTSVCFLTSVPRPAKGKFISDLRIVCKKFVSNSDFKLDFYDTSLEREEAQREKKKQAEEAAQQQLAKKFRKTSPAKGALPSPSKAASTTSTPVHLVIWRTTNAGGSQIRTDAKHYQFTNMLFGEATVPAAKITRNRAGSISSTGRRGAVRVRSSSALPKPPDQLYKLDAESELDELVVRARKLKQEQRDDEGIKKFCTDVENPVFQQCVEEWKQKAMTECDAFYTDLEQDSRSRVDFMTRQAEMMQRHTILV